MRRDTASLKVAIIGTGFGVRTQLPAFRLAGGWEVVSLTGVDREKTRRLAEAHGVPHALSGAAEAVEVGEPDLVCVATPPSHHLAMGITVLKGGRHCLLEKPMALTSREAEALAAAAREVPRLALVDHQLRALPSRQEMKRRIAAGDLGVPLHARVTFTSDGRARPGRPWNWWSRAADGGGILGAIGSHVIDMLVWWFGEVADVRAALETAIPVRPDAAEKVRKVETDEIADLHLTFRSGPTGTITLTTVAHHYAGFVWEIHGTEGSLWIDPEGRLIGARRGDAREEDLSPPDHLGAGTVLDGSLWSRGFVLLASALGEAIWTGKDVPFAATFEDGLNTQRVLDAARLSAKTGRRITLSADEIPRADSRQGDPPSTRGLPA